MVMVMELELPHRFRMRARFVGTHRGECSTGLRYLEACKIFQRQPSHEPYRFCRAENPASLYHWQVNESCPVLHLPGTWFARSHGLEGSRDSQLSEISIFIFIIYRASASCEHRTRDHRNEVTGQSPGHGASRMKQAVPNVACDVAVTPPLSASMSIVRV